MAMQGNKRAAEGSPTSDNRQSTSDTSNYSRNASASNEPDGIREARNLLEQIFTDIDKMPQSEEGMAFINDLKKKKEAMEGLYKEKFVVTVLGRTGAGKSSLLNAILGEKKLLPCCTINACTSVIIQLEANMANSKYEAEIEFIPEADWRQELQSIDELLSDEKDMDKQTAEMLKSKIRALYGNDGVGKNVEILMEMQNFSHLFEAGKEYLSSDNVSEFSAQIKNFVYGGTSIKRGYTTQYWPLVKCVIIKVPNAQDLLGNLVLVDVPGSGDWNKARDKMWEASICSCSSVWVVADIDRAAADRDAWNILDSSINYLGPNGQCQSISFICTKTDNISSSYELEDEDCVTDGEATSAQTREQWKRACILDRNIRAKKIIEDDVCDQYEQLGKIEVFTVSAEEFRKPDSVLRPEETEIPQLRALLKKLNAEQSDKRTKSYILDAFGIISLIRVKNSAQKKTILEMEQTFARILEPELQIIRQFMLNTKETFDNILKLATAKSANLCAERMLNVIAPAGTWMGYHQTLKSACRNGGFRRSKNGGITELNFTLATTMYDAICETFHEVFSMGVNKKSLFKKIEDFNIISDSLQNCMSQQHVDFIKTQVC
ncbi:nuclear GTPase SLIP-GC-like [Lampris incognitus]|uniref:nuclear GTPase SLIP-GC-like n=1 Tax=Lampris incognitus TaxID=2546036 RepID=UPI0024B48C39|nr:nuclear GTPase SLIP-GC-like [Lampris incognitus]